MASALTTPPHELADLAPGQQKQQKQQQQKQQQQQQQQLAAGISTTESILFDSFGDMGDPTTTTTAAATATVTSPRRDEGGEEEEHSSAFDASDSPRSGTAAGGGTRRSKRAASRSNDNTSQKPEAFSGTNCSNPERPESTAQGARPKREGARRVPLLELTTPPCCASRPAARQPQPQPSLSSRSEGLYGRSPNSCNRHLRRSCRDREIEEGAPPKSPRKELFVGMTGKKYKRLEADMFRSRIELVNTLSAMETDRAKYSRDLGEAKQRVADFEAALREADEVLQNLTLETKRQRRIGEEREASLHAQVATLRLGIKQSVRECRHEKLSTWGTVARESERAAGRERYRMTAFLQRYVLENEFLRASKTKAEELAAKLQERLRQCEEKLAKAQLASAGDPDIKLTASRKSASTPGTAGGRDATPASPSKSFGGKAATRTTRTPHVSGGGGVGGGGGDGGGRATTSPMSRKKHRTDTDDPPVLTQAELAVRRLKERLEGGSGSPTSGDEASRRGTGRGGGGRAAAATVTARRELRSARGLVAELSSLLSSTENERDSLASLLVLAEHRMERMTVGQEEAALHMAWGNASARKTPQQTPRQTARQTPRQQRRRQRKEKQQQQQQHNIGSNGSVTGETGTRDTALGQTATLAAADHRQPESTPNHPLLAPTATTSAGPAKGATAQEERVAVIEAIELRCRVRDLEALLNASEAGAREVQKENRRLKTFSQPSSGAWGSSLLPWEEPYGVTPSTGKTRQSGAHPGGERGYDGDRDGHGRASRSSNGGGCDASDFGFEKTAVGRENAGLENSVNQENIGFEDAASWENVGADSSSLPLLSGATTAGKNDSRKRTRTAGLFSGTEKPLDCRYPGAYPEGQSRPMSSLPCQEGEFSVVSVSPLSQQREQQNEQHLQQQQQRREVSEDAGVDLVTEQQLAWVLGLPAATTTPYELLARVMHLVAERGAASTDAATLESQLAEMDAQSLSLTRLVTANAAAAAATQMCRGDQSLSGDGRGGGSGGGSGGGASGPDGDRESDLEKLRLLSLPYEIGTGNSHAAAAVGGAFSRVGTHGTHRSGSDCGSGIRRRRVTGEEGGNVSRARTAGRPGGKEGRPGGRMSLNGGGNGTAWHPNDNGSVSGEVTVAQTASQSEAFREHAATGRRSQSAEGFEPRAVGDIPKPGGAAGLATALAGMTVAGVVAAAAAAAVGEAPPSAAALAEATAGETGAAGPADERSSDELARASFQRTLQGRVVTVDIFCTKVPPSTGQGLGKERGGATGHKGMSLEDDDEYEIRVEAYDPAVLKHHVLNIYEDDIRRCFSSHPQLYTLGPHRRRVHKSLVERLIFMSEDDVEAERNQQGGGGGGLAETPVGGTPPADGLGLGGSGRIGGRRPSGFGLKGEPSQLLVLLGDAGEIVLAERSLSEGIADARERGRKRFHRLAKSAIQQIEREDEIVEGAVYQDAEPLEEEADCEATELAKRLSTMDSTHSSQRDDEEVQEQEQELEQEQEQEQGEEDEEMEETGDKGEEGAVDSDSEYEDDYEFGEGEEEEEGGGAGEQGRGQDQGQQGHEEKHSGD